MKRASDSTPAPPRRSSRPKKQPKLFGVVRNPDLSYLRRGVSYTGAEVKSSARDEMQGCFPELHDVGYSAATDLEKQGEDAFWEFLEPAGWKPVKRHGALDTSWSYVAHPFALRTATEGVTMFRTCEAIGEQLKRDGGDANKILERARASGAFVPPQLLSAQQETESTKDSSEKGDEGSPVENVAALGAKERAATLKDDLEGVKEKVLPQVVPPPGHQEEQGSQQGHKADQADSDSPGFNEVCNWLGGVLGGVHESILKEYAKRMVDYGLDSVAILEKDLYHLEYQENISLDVIKMKPVHRQLLRQKLDALFMTRLQNYRLGIDPPLVPPEPFPVEFTAPPGPLPQADATSHLVPPPLDPSPWMMPFIPNHYEMVNLQHMDLLCRIQETALMMNIYQHQRQQQSQETIDPTTIGTTGNMMTQATAFLPPFMPVDSNNYPLMPLKPNGEPFDYASLFPSDPDPRSYYLHPGATDPIFGQLRASLGLGGGFNIQQQAQMMEQPQREYREQLLRQERFTQGSTCVGPRNLEEATHAGGSHDAVKEESPDHPKEFKNPDSPSGESSVADADEQAAKRAKVKECDDDEK